MKYVYNKLVRDKIPSDINSVEGKNATFKFLDDDEFLDELNKKLLEESNEFIEANDVTELADVVEVIESIMKVKNITWEEVKETQRLKRIKKGGFDYKIYLESVEE